MSNKTKNSKTSKETLAQVSQQLGLVLMTAAVTFGLFEAPDHSSKVVIPNQPAFALAENGGGHSGEGDSNTLRRERDEAGPHYISYSIAQRTPGRHGKV